MHGTAVCQTCQAPVAGHSVCPNCGYYKGVKVLRTKVDRMHGRVARRQALEMAMDRGAQSTHEGESSHNAA